MMMMGGGLCDIHQQQQTYHDLATFFKTLFFTALCAFLSSIVKIKLKNIVRRNLAI